MGFTKYCSNLSNFNYKPQTESHQQQLALHMDRHLRSVAIMIEVTSRHMECTYFNSNYNRMPAVSLQWWPREEATSSPMQLDGSVFSQAAQAIVEWLSPNVKTAFQLKSWRESHLLRPASLSLFQRQRGRHVATPATSSLLKYFSTSSACVRRGIV